MNVFLVLKWIQLFYSSSIGNTGLNGTVNNIRLENALKNLPNQTIRGRKHFENILEVLADVKVNRSINEVYLEQFVWSSRNEVVKEVSSFFFLCLYIVIFDSLI